MVCFDSEALSKFLQASLIVIAITPRPESGQTLRPIKFRDAESLRNAPATIDNTDEKRLKELEREIFYLKISNRGKNFLIGELNKERNGFSINFLMPTEPLVSWKHNYTNWRNQNCAERAGQLFRHLKLNRLKLLPTKSCRSGMAAGELGLSSRAHLAALWASSSFPNCVSTAARV